MATTNVYWLNQDSESVSKVLSELDYIVEDFQLRRVVRKGQGHSINNHYRNA